MFEQAEMFVDADINNINITDDTQALTIIDAPPSRAIGTPLPSENFKPNLDQMVAAWLHAKFHKSQSTQTLRHYREIMAAFREVLGQAGIDLDGNPSLIATLAQGWFSLPRLNTSPDMHPLASTIQKYNKMVETGSEIGAGTANYRITVISSFYEYCIKHDWFVKNPMKMVERRTGGGENYAHHMEKEEVQKNLARIERKSLIGKRDFAMLFFWHMTGRRIGEIWAVRWGDITFDDSGGAICVFPRCKGAKRMEDRLEPEVQAAILDYMHALYGDDLDALPPDTALWVDLSYKDTRKPIAITALRGICRRRIGTGKTHSIRHTFAIGMLKAGADISDIASRLGHTNAATTGTYLKRALQAENPYAASLVQAFTGDGTIEVDTDSAYEGKIRAKRERAEQAILAHPEMSNAEIGRLLGLDASTVCRHRQRIGKSRPVGSNGHGAKRETSKQS